MFKKIAAETLGISDIGVIISPADYKKVDADDYLFHEDGEKIFFLIKSKKDEYCFTNLALIHIDGESALSSKRLVKRYPYGEFKVGGVTIETAGGMDMDIELKFNLGNQHFSIDISKNAIEPLKDIYKALSAIAFHQHKEGIAQQNAHTCLDALKSMYNITKVEDEDSIVKHYNAMLENFNSTLLDRYTTWDYSAIFEKYIRA